MNWDAFWVGFAAPFALIIATHVADRALHWWLDRRRTP